MSPVSAQIFTRCALITLTYGSKDFYRKIELVASVCYMPFYTSYLQVEQLASTGGWYGEDNVGHWVCLPTRLPKNKGSSGGGGIQIASANSHLQGSAQLEPELSGKLTSSHILWVRPQGK